MAKKQTNGYPWKFCSLGGVVRVNITSGEDIAHLGELDQKLWTVLACPVKDLEFDEKTLQLIDTDGDGRIRVAEIVAAAQWITSVVKDKDAILKGEGVLKLDGINTDCEAGAKLYGSAKQILSNLGLDKDEITVEEASDSVAIFAKTQFNGDGVITQASADDETLRPLIATIAEKAGSATDRSGEPGITAEHIEAFYTALADYAAWQDAAAADRAAIFPYGDDTAAALDACNAVKDKVADYFMRCKLIRFDDAVSGAVDVSAERLGAISDKNLATQSEEIASYPLARPGKEAVLPLDAVNPAWQPAFAAVRALVLDKEFPKAEGITEEQWAGVLAKFAPYTAWMGAKKGEAVESLGIDEVKALLKADRKAELLALVEADKALEEEAGSIDEVGRLMRYYRDPLYFTLLKMMKNPYDAEDLTIEAFGKAFKNLEKYTTDYAFSTWLFKIAINNCIDYMRRKNTSPQCVDEDFCLFENSCEGTPMQSQEETVMQKERAEMMRWAVAQLRPKYRTLIELRYFQELSYEEISQELNISMNNVKIQLFRAKYMLGAIMEKMKYAI